LEWTTHPVIERILAHKRWWAQRAILLVLIVVAVFVLRPYLASALGAGAGLALGAVYFLAYLFAVVMLPLMVFTLMRFAYSVFARPFVRAWHINRIRNKRYMKEVIGRSRTED
jgi:membrane protein implicated in regulation of membrane protease activity